MRLPAWLRITPISSDNRHEARFNRTFASVAHLCPPDGQALTPCCDRTPFELPMTDRLTLDPALMTCAGTGANPSIASVHIGPKDSP